ncbi:MAG TPA: YraN family protein [Thermaerobacter sp.]
MNGERPRRGDRPGRRDLGRRSEELAARHLEALGYRVVARNVRCPGGEADLICREGGEWVVVEVRGRRTRRFGTAAQSVDARKFRRLVRVGQWFLTRAGLPDAPWRIDLVTVTWPPAADEPGGGAAAPTVAVYRRLEGGAQR